MRNQDTVGEAAVDELLELRQRVAELEALQEESKKTEERLSGLVETLLNLGPDRLDNMNHLKQACGELMRATHAVCNGREQRTICSLDRRKAPPNYDSTDPPGVRICDELTKEAGAETVVGHDLHKTEFALKAPNLIRYNWKTYVGQAVKLGERSLGSLAVAYQKDFVPSETDTSLSRAITTLGREERGSGADDTRGESDAKYRAVFDNLAIGINLKDSKGHFLEMNSALPKMLGYTPEELATLTYVDVTHPDEVLLSREKHESLIRGEIDSYRIEKRYLRKDGSIMWGDTSVSAIRDQGGNHLITTGVIVDVTEKKRAENSVLREKNFSDMTIDALPGVFYLLDDQFKFLRWNKNCEIVSGYPAAEIAARSPLDFFEGEDKRVMAEGIQEVLSKGEASREASLITKDGQKIPYLFGGNLVTLDHSQCVIGMGVDISSRKAAEEALRVQTERSEMLCENAPYGMIMIAPNGTSEYVNPKFEEIVGYDLTDVPTGKEWFTKAFPDPAYRHKVISSWVEDLKTHATGAASTRVFTVTCKDKAQKKIHFTLVRLRTGVDVATLEDITDREIAQERLRESEERMRLLIEASPVGIGIVQEDKFAYANPALIRMVGCSGLDEMVGESALTFIAPKDRVRIRRRAQKRLQGLEVLENYQVTGVRKSGERMDVSIWPRRIDYEGKKALLTFVVDVTEENGLKAQLLQAQKLEAVGTLAGGIAHDFNNLLTVVLGYSELLLDEMGQDLCRQDLEKINEASRRGAELVRNLLTFSRKADTKPRPINLNYEVERIHKLLSRTIPKMIEIDLRLSSDLAIINADPGQMGQVLMNLALNARDAMPEGGKLTIATENIYLDQENGSESVGVNHLQYVMLTISDSGEGMDSETLAHIFEPFYTTKDVGKGTGLGLAMVYGIVEQHGGHVTCESKPGVGTTFRIYLPSMGYEGTAPEDVSEVAIPAPGTESILLVDDEELIRDLGAEFLTAAGYTVLTASNGLEAVRLYRENREAISLVILDLIMPEMGGAKCLEQILEIDPDAKIIISSGATIEGRQRETIESKARCFVRKPFELKDILTTVRKVLDSD